MSLICRLARVGHTELPVHKARALLHASNGPVCAVGLSHTCDGAHMLKACHMSDMCHLLIFEIGLLLMGFLLGFDSELIVYPCLNQNVENTLKSFGLAFGNGSWG